MSSNFAAVFLFFIYPVCISSQTSGAEYLRLPDDAMVMMPARWYKADKLIFDKMKKQTTGSQSGLQYLLFPTDDIFKQHGYPFISIGFTFMGENVMRQADFREIVDEHKRMLSGMLEKEMNIIRPHQFDTMKFSDMVVDETRKIIIYRNEVGVPNYGQVDSYNALIVSKTGFVRFSLNSLKADMDKYRPAFNVLIKTYTSR